MHFKKIGVFEYCILVPEEFTLLTILLQNVTFRLPEEPNVLEDIMD